MGRKIMLDFYVPLTTKVTIRWVIDLYRRTETMKPLNKYIYRKCFRIEMDQEGERKFQRLRNEKQSIQIRIYELNSSAK